MSAIAHAQGQGATPIVPCPMDTMTMDTQKLTARQSQAMELLCNGHTDSEIAKMMGIGIGAIRKKWLRISEKFGQFDEYGLSVNRVKLAVYYTAKVRYRYNDKEKAGAKVVGQADDTTAKVESEKG